MASFDYRFGHSNARDVFRTALTTGSILAVAVTAHAQTYSTGTAFVNPSLTQLSTFNANTTSGTPTFNESFIGGGTAVPYSSNTFTATTTGIYQFTTTVTSGYSGGTRLIQFLYSPTFDPKNPSTNYLGFTQPTNSTINYQETLTANQALTLVDGGISNTDTGTAQTVISRYNPGSTIPDSNSIVGSSQTITVTNTSAITSFNSITINGLTHPFVGDLVATLTHTTSSGTTIVDLFDHVAANNNPSDPGYNYGQGSAAAFNGNYTFSLTGADLAVVADGATAPMGTTYKASGNAATGFDMANAGNTLNSFLGQSEAGTWTLSIRDEQIGDTGSFTGFSFTVNAAPEPSQYAGLGIGILGVGCLALRARRRRAV